VLLKSEGFENPQQARDEARINDANKIIQGVLLIVAACAMGKVFIFILVKLDAQDLLKIFKRIFFYVYVVVLL